MPYTEFTNTQIDFYRLFLKENSGYNLIDGKEYLLGSRLRPVLKIHDIENHDFLINAIKSDPHGQIATDVIEAMTVNETFFFRDDKPFQFFKSEILPQLIEASKKRFIKIWSAACSTGQEPYSIAILMSEAQKAHPHLNFKIKASDINQRILARARQGLYSKMEVERGLLPELKKNYFTKISDQAWTINDDIKKLVTFQQQNLRDNFSFITGNYDVIFLRNVLIYFDLELKTETLNKVSQHMHSDSYLILGAAENIYDMGDKFNRVPNTTGIYRKA